MATYPWSISRCDANVFMEEESEQLRRTSIIQRGDRAAETVMRGCVLHTRCFGLLIVGLEQQVQNSNISHNY